MAVIATTVHAASPTSGGLILGLLLLDYFHDLIWYPQVFDLPEISDQNCIGNVTEGLD